MTITDTQTSPFDLVACAEHMNGLTRAGAIRFAASVVWDAASRMEDREKTEPAHAYLTSDRSWKAVSKIAFTLMSGAGGSIGDEAFMIAVDQAAAMTIRSDPTEPGHLAAAAAILLAEAALENTPETPTLLLLKSIERIINAQVFYARACGDHAESARTSAELAIIPISQRWVRTPENIAKWRAERSKHAAGQAPDDNAADPPATA